MRRIGFFLLIMAIPLLATANEKPNVLWLTSEDNSVDWLGCYGNVHANTPNLDRLAREGFQYMHTYANAPVCAPQRCTWITGVLALSMGTHPMRSNYKIPHDKIRLYPDSLKANGYYTGNSTKTDYNFGGRDGKGVWDHPGKVRWNSLKDNQPFFQVVNFGASHESKAFGNIEHTQHQPTYTTLAKYHPDVPELRKNYAHYHDAVSRMDSQIGETLKRLDESGLSENTIVVYNSDHGGVLPRSKRFLFRSGIHCPLIVRIPKKYKQLWPAQQPGVKIERLVSFVDMPKTWLSLTGSKIPRTMQGKIFLGPQTELESASHFAFRGRMDERIDNARAVCDKRFLYIRNYMPYVPWLQRLTYLWNMKATQAWDAAVQNGLANEIQSRFFAPKEWTEELYNLQDDPDNVINLANDPAYAEVLKQMRSRLRQHQLDCFDAGLIPETEMVRLANSDETTIYDLVRDPSKYDLPALLDAADLALAKRPENLPALHEMLNHAHVGMRYWGIVGCFLLNDQSAGMKGIEDSSHEVRAMAAWILVRNGDKEKGVACLQEMIDANSYAMLTILNMVDWMGSDAKALLPSVTSLRLPASKNGNVKYLVRMRDLVRAKHSLSNPD